MIQSDDSDTIVLSNRVQIEIAAASFRSTRGYTYGAVLADEIAFWRSDESLNPDVEILRALRPGLSTIPGAIMLLASSPYGKKGALYNSYRRHFGKNDARTLVWKAPTEAMNPMVDKAVIADAYAEDPEAARAEYGAEFRDDLADFVSRETIDAVTCTGRTELPPIAGLTYSGFVDVSAGAQDSYTMAIAHMEGDKGVLDLLYERRPPFHPDEVTAEVCGLLKRFSVSRVTADHFAGQWAVVRFAEHGITLAQCARPKSEIYLDCLPLLTGARVELLQSARLTAQFCGLERRTGRSGKDSVAEPPGSHDDCCNVVAGVLVGLDLDRRPAMIRQADLLTADLPAVIEHPAGFSTVVWVTPDGNAAVALFSHEIAPDGASRIVLEWFDAAPWTSALLLDASRHMDELCDAAFSRSDAVKGRGGCAAFLLVQQQLLQPGIVAMQTVFAAKLEVESYRRRGRTRNVDVLPIAPAYASNAARLALGAAGHVASGSVKLSAVALSLSSGKPLLGSLAVKPGEAVDANPLRMALLVGIAQLDPEWTAEEGAQVQFG
jgi:hypothetical protein